WPKRPRGLTMERAATCWMHAAALGVREVLDWLSERIRLMDGGDESIGGKEMNALCTLTAHFATGRDVGALESSGWAPIGAYRSVAERTLRPDDYETLAAYHAKRTGGAGFPEFQF